MYEEDMRRIRKTVDVVAEKTEKIGIFLNFIGRQIISKFSLVICVTTISIAVLIFTFLLSVFTGKKHQT